jgi:sugar/nucleoside kinase (ribokinase family)
LPRQKDMTMNSNRSVSPLKVLGVGNALVDIMIALPDDSLLNQFGLPRGSMTLVDSKQSAVIYQATMKYRKDVTTGGSAANTIHSLACLGGICGYAGKIGDDDLGRLFAAEFKQHNITTHLPLSSLDTGRVMAMVSADSERTMATFLGAAAGLTSGDFSNELMQRYDMVYVEGYLVQDQDLIESIVKTAHDAGLKVAVDLSSYNIVAQNLDFLKSLVTRYVDIVFANEEEAMAFTGFEPLQALEAISLMCEVAVVKTGRHGSLVKQGDKVYNIFPVPAKAVDTTGAGDSYAAGFLYGLTRGLDLQKCGEIASLVSSKAVETMGAKIPEDSWPALLKKVREIETR